MKKEYTDCVTALSDFATEALKKMSEPLEVSFLNVKLLTQDLEVRGFLDNKVKTCSVVRRKIAEVNPDHCHVVLCLLGTILTCVPNLIGTSKLKKVHLNKKIYLDCFLRICFDID